MISKRLAAALVVAAGLLPGPSQAQGLTYAGKEAELLKCAAMISAMMQVGKIAGELSPAEYRMGLSFAETFLERLPGNRRQKGRALEIMLTRLLLDRTPEEIAADFERTVPRCEALSDE